MHGLDDIPPSFMESILQADVPSFLDESNCADKLAFMASSDSDIYTDSEGDDSEMKCNSLLDDVMGDDGNCELGDDPEAKCISLLEDILDDDSDSMLGNDAEMKCNSLLQDILDDNSDCMLGDPSESKCNGLLEDILGDEAVCTQPSANDISAFSEHFRVCSDGGYNQDSFSDHFWVLSGFGSRQDAFSTPLKAPSDCGSSQDTFPALKAPSDCGSSKNSFSELLKAPSDCAPSDCGNSQDVFSELLKAPSEYGSSQNTFSELLKAPSDCGSNQDVFLDLLKAPSDCGSSQNSFSELLKVPSDYGSNQDVFLERLQAPSDCGSSQDTFVGLPMAPSNDGSSFFDSMLSQLALENSNASAKFADIPTLFKPPVLCREQTPLQLTKHKPFTVPGLPRPGCGSSNYGGGLERRFEAHVAGAGFIARVAHAVGDFVLVPLSPLTPSPISGANLPRTARNKRRSGIREHGVCSGDGDLLIRLQRALAASVFVPTLPTAADRARHAACKQQRLYARQKLDAKRLRWKQAAATLADANAARSGDKKLTNYPMRQQAANGRSRTGGKFQKENKGVFLSASQL